MRAVPGGALHGPIRNFFVDCASIENQGIIFEATSDRSSLSTWESSFSNGFREHVPTAVETYGRALPKRLRPLYER